MEQGLENRKSRMAELIKIKAGFATVGQGAGPMMVTWKAGLFRKHGLDVDRPPVMGGAKGVVRGLMSGEIQFGNLAAPAPLRANLKGEADVVFLTGGINQQFLVGRPGIHSREDLAGKKIGTVNDGGIGDALVGWENEAFLVKSQPAGADFEIVTPSTSILAEPTVTWVDTNTRRKGTGDVAKAYLEYLYSPEGQELAAKHCFRPSDPEVLARHRSQFLDIPLFTIEEKFGSWKKANDTHFAEGGVFDQIYER